ncbi:hypothetical protein [Rhodococcus sp. SGAir0479]|uniref:hypothetical protein n=1 Tax=Rhodococcus sp. SGAir0479 TaxID=2567884 RepID=UPI0010CCD68B|nr:hypothetical protein [Rhodococcus sp. SGAir0479]QCQ92298.1 hypothetical protein E7742_14435 [Rhodococcus sp. SGAir0479]
MDTVTKTADALWQVVLVGLLFGAGLPAVFALGLKSLAAGTGSGADGSPSTAGKIGAVACFAVVLIAIAAGILMLMWKFLTTTFGIAS